MIANERCRDFAQTNREKRGNFAPGGPSSPEYRKVILRVSFFLNFRTHGTKSPHFLYWYVLNRDTPQAIIELECCVIIDIDRPKVYYISQNFSESKHENQWKYTVMDF